MYGMFGGSWQLSGYNNTYFYLTVPSQYWFGHWWILSIWNSNEWGACIKYVKIRIENLQFTSLAHMPYLYFMWTQCVVKLSILYKNSLINLCIERCNDMKV